MKLHIGQLVLDTHGLGTALTIERLNEMGLITISHTKVSIPYYANINFAVLIESIAKANAEVGGKTYGYFNKMLMVVGYDYSNNTWALMSSYDGNNLNTFIVKEQELTHA